MKSIELNYISIEIIEKDPNHKSSFSEKEDLRFLFLEKLRNLIIQKKEVELSNDLLEKLSIDILLLISIENKLMRMVNPSIEEITFPHKINMKILENENPPNNMDSICIQTGFLYNK